MKEFEDELLTEVELSEMLATWTIPEAPSAELKARIFACERKSPWRVFGGLRGRAAGVSLLIHASALGFMLTVFQSSAVRTKVREVAQLYFTPLSNYRPKPALKAGGGGGGAQDQTAAHGEAPKFAAKQFVPPALAVPQPKMPVVPTITAQAPEIVADQYGDPLSKLSDGAFGKGVGTGIGPGNGNGYGKGDGGGMGDGVFIIGGEVSAPTLISKIEPEYSEEARRAKYSGSILLSVVVDQHGIPRDIKVIRGVGLGLDEKAIEAVTRWRFRPGMRHGHPVAVQAQVEVSFRLL